MEFDFDPIKDAANIAKHGLALGDAALLDWDKATIYPDLRRAHFKEVERYEKSRI